MYSRVRLWVLAVVLSAGVAEARAQLKAEPAKVDLGPHKQGETISAEVLLINAGPKPVEILSTTADCSCTVAKPEKANLAPGESTPLRLTVKTLSYQGDLRRSVHVLTSAGDLTLYIDLTVNPYTHWKLTPPVIIMPPSQNGTASVAQATLNYTAAGKAKLGKLTCTPDYLEITTATEDGRKFDLTFKKRTETPTGNHSLKVTLETSDPVDPIVSLNLFLPNATEVAVKAETSGSDPRLPKVALRVIPEVAPENWTRRIVNDKPENETKPCPRKAAASLVRNLKPKSALKRLKALSRSKR